MTEPRRIEARPAPAAPTSSLPAATTVPPAERMDRFYQAIRLTGRFWLWFFFKSVDVRNVRRVPDDGPVLLCINHPNNLIDSLLVGAVVPRKVHYLATAALFRRPVVARFLRAAGAIPVYRKQDDPAHMDRNVDAFTECFAAFDRGALVAIYPEGTTHSETRVQRIKTGAARIALDYDARNPGALTVVPVGLNFEARKSFHGRVLASFGPPVPVGAYRAAYRTDPTQAVDALTTAIQHSMEAEVVHVDRIEAAEVVRAVEQLYRAELVRQLEEERGLGAEQVDLFRLSRAIVDAVEHFKARDPGRVERLWHRIQSYRALLAECRIRDYAVQEQLSRPRLPRRLLTGWKAIIGLPVFAYGAAVNALPYYVPRWVAHRMARKETDYATTRLLASIVAFPVFWGVEIAIVGWMLGLRAALLFAVTLPLSGLIAYRYLVTAGRLRNQLRFAALALRHETAAKRLVAERQAIVAELERAKSDYLGATKGSSF